MSVEKVKEVVHQKLFEIGHGPVTLMMAFVNDKGDTITPFFKCKDYFNDLFWSNKTDNSVDICGFKWKPNEDNGVLKKPTIKVALKKVKISDKSNKNGGKQEMTKEEVKSVESFFKKVQRKLKFKPLKAYLSEDNYYMIVEFDRKWTEIPYLNSAFFLMLRMSITYKDSEDIVKYYEPKTKELFISPHDINYFQAIKGRLQDIIDGKIDTEQTYEMYNHGNIHGSSGIVSYSNYKIK